MTVNQILSTKGERGILYTINPYSLRSSDRQWKNIGAILIVEEQS
jgi:hypothetical protein